MEFDFGELIVDEELEFGELELDVVRQTPPLIDLEVIPTVEEQIFNHEGEYGYDEVKVKAVTGETLNIVPSKEEQKFNGVYTEVNVDGLVTSALNIIPTTEEQSFEGLYEKVTAHPVTSEIDSNIIPENIADGKTILGVQGNFKGSKYAPKHISFYNYAGTDLDYELENLDISNLDNFYYMFANCKQVAKIDTSHFVNENIKDVRYMYYSCSALTEIDLSNLNAQNVTQMSSICYLCGKLTKADFSGLHGTISSLSMTFSGCYKLMHLDLRNLDISNASIDTTTYNGLPKNCLIIVKDEACKSWLNIKMSSYTNVKTLAEYQAEGGV